MKSKSALFLASLSLLFILAACSPGDAAPVPSADEGQSQESSAPTATTPPTEISEELPPIAPKAEYERLDLGALPVFEIGPPGNSPDEISRPTLSGSMLFLDSPHFRVHYTLSGNDAVEANDANGNAHPDYIEEIAALFEYAWQTEIEHFGWAVPPTDGDLGGSSAIDVYILNVLNEDFLAAVDEDDGERGDNPNTSIVESGTNSSYVSFGRLGDFEGSLGDLSALEAAQTTVVHEFLHLIQNGYDASEPYTWIWEASADWIMDEVMESLDAMIVYTSAVAKSSDTCIHYAGDISEIEAENRWYGYSIFLRYLSEQYGHDVVRQIWDFTIENDSLEAVNLALAEYGSDLLAEMQNFAIALLARDFQDGAAMPTVRLEGSLSPGQSFEPRDGVSSLGFDNYEILADGPVSVQISNADLQAQFLGLRNGQAERIAFQGNASLDAGKYEHVYLSVLNPHQAQDEFDCQDADYSLSISAGGSPQIAVDRVISAQHFAVPQVEIQLAQLGLPYIPADYSLFWGYIQSRQELADVYSDEAYAAALLPGEGQVYYLDYYHSNETDYVSTYTSQSPYADLEAFLAAQSYFGGSPAQTRVNGTEIGTFFAPDFETYNAFFVKDGLLHAFVSTGTEEELNKIVAAFLEGSEVDLLEQSLSGNIPEGYDLPYLPESYRYEDFYEVTRDSFWDPELVDYYIPADVTAYNIDYFGPDEGILYIIWSASPYANLEAYIVDTDYDRSALEFQTINGIETIYEDLGDAKGPYWSVVIVHAGQFIVIEGPISRSEMDRVVGAFLESDLAPPEEPAPPAEESNVAPSGLPPETAGYAFPYLPAGFAFSEFYEVTRDTFWGDASTVDYYIPADVTALDIDYAGPNDAILYILWSASPYANLDEYLTATDYDQDLVEFKTIAGQEVIFEELGSPSDPYWSLTMIRSGEFVVIEGAIERTEMDKVLIAWLEQ